MSAPSYVNAGSLNSSSGTSSTAALPGSRVNGNLLFAVIQVLAGSKTFSIGSGWTIGDTSTDGSTSTAWAWYIVNGSEAAPAFSWSGSATYYSKVYQISGNDISAPIGAIANGAATSTTMSVGSITTTRNNSLVIATEWCNPGQGFSGPTGFTDLDAVNDGTSSHRFGVETQSTSGSASDPISISVGSTNWHAFLAEILSPLPPPPSVGGGASLIAGL